MRVVAVNIHVEVSGECRVQVDYPPLAYTCVQALQPKDTIVSVQRRQEGLLKRCTEINDVLPDFCELVEAKWAQMAARVKTTAPLLRRMQADLFAIQRSLHTLKRRLGP